MFQSRSTFIGQDPASSDFQHADLRLTMWVDTSVDEHCDGFIANGAINRYAFNTRRAHAMALPSSGMWSTVPAATAAS